MTQSSFIVKVYLWTDKVFFLGQVIDRAVIGRDPRYVACLSMDMTV